MLSVRNITGYAVSTVDIPPKASVRHVTGYGFYSKSRFDRTILGRDNLLAVLGSECFSVFSDIATLATPIAVNEVGKKNTKILITAKDGVPYRSNFYMYYNRIGIDRYFPDTSWKLTVAADTTVLALLSTINTAYGCKLAVSDVVDKVVKKNSTGFVLTASPDSFLALPGSTVQLGVPLPTMAAIVSVTRLSGFEAVIA